MNANTSKVPDWVYEGAFKEYRTSQCKVSPKDRNLWYEYDLPKDWTKSNKAVIVQALWRDMQQVVHLRKETRE